MGTPLPCRIFSVISLTSPFRDFSPFGITHSPMGRSDVGNPRLALLFGCWIVGYAFVSLSALSAVSHKFIDRPQIGMYYLQYLCRGYQVIFPRPHTTGTGNSHLANTALSSYPFIVTVQSCSFTFKQLTVFQSCYVPVSAFAFRLDWSITALSYGIVPNYL